MISTNAKEHSEELTDVNIGINPEILKDLNYLDGLNMKQLNFLRQYLSIRIIKKGELFLSEGDWCDSLYFIISGVVKVFKISRDGKKQILNIATNGESLNDVSTFDHS